MIMPNSGTNDEEMIINLDELDAPDPMYADACDPLSGIILMDPLDTSFLKE